MNYTDIFIIGAGPIGIACGIESRKRNFSHLIVEKGCLVNSIFHYPTNMVFFSTSDRLEIGEIPFVSHGDKPTRREALEYYRRVTEAWKLNVKTYEEVKKIIKLDNGFKVETSKDEYSTKKIIIATGFFDFPNLLKIPGEELPKVKHYFDEAHPYAYLNIVVIGGGNSAVDIALETFRRKANVTMVVREEKLKDSIKYWVRPDIENRIKEGSIKALFNSQVVNIKEDSVDIKTPEKIISVKNDFVFAMTGYHPDYKFLREAGIKISNDELMLPEFNPETHESNVPEIYLAGVVCGGMETGKWFIENARFQAVSILDDISIKIKE
ncbi:MAG TPA: YpdA family putative bacillithiol disulfide reductase [Ignavibacteriaceae bacterium]|nr:YpdA family putative bacillithiol disulfide reductase [Ignavibacteriaceae bacterium]